MAERFLTLMADLDDASQALMSGWYERLKRGGFTGTQTPGLPFHISLATYPLEQEAQAVALMKKVAGAFSPFPVHISHIGLFSGGKVLFGAPERNPRLDDLHDACLDPREPWTPHVTLLIDEPATVCTAIPLLLEAFQPFVGTVTGLHLCAFWPTREILSVRLTGDK